jgi:hypothetical protein
MRTTQEFLGLLVLLVLGYFIIHNEIESLQRTLLGKLDELIRVVKSGFQEQQNMAGRMESALDNIELSQPHGKCANCGKRFFGRPPDESYCSEACAEVVLGPILDRALGPVPKDQDR